MTGFEEGFKADLAAGMWDSCKLLAALVATILATMWMLGCSMHTVYITPADINATSAALLYCPAATVLRVHEGNRTVDILSNTSGVGAVVTEVMHP